MAWVLSVWNHKRMYGSVGFIEKGVEIEHDTRNTSDLPVFVFAFIRIFVSCVSCVDAGAVPAGICGRTAGGGSLSVYTVYMLNFYNASDESDAPIHSFMMSNR